MKQLCSQCHGWSWLPGQWIPKTRRKTGHTDWKWVCPTCLHKWNEAAGKYDKIRQLRKTKSKCSKCNRPHYARGLCSKHYQADWKRRRKDERTLDSDV